MVSREVLDEIRSKVDMVKFLEDRGTTFRTSGTSQTALCPFHSERSPSFHVRSNTDQQRWHCFGCSEGGDIFTLVERLESLTFFGAVQFLADEVGIKITTDEDDEKYKKTRRIYEICAIAAHFFRKNFTELTDSHPAKQNLADRGLLEYANVTETIGYAPTGGLLKVINAAGYSTAEAVEAGVVKNQDVANAGAVSRFNSMNKGSVKEVFRNRLIWTICDTSGKPIAFSGRKVYDTDTMSPKYVNSPQTPLYNKSQTLLGLHAAKKSIVSSQSVYVMEGQTDVDAARAAGIENVVATCGTAFGQHHAGMLQRLAKTGKNSEKFKFIFCFDLDAAGVKAAEKVFTNIPDIQLNSYVASILPPGMTEAEGQEQKLDPCEVRKIYGDDMLRELLESQKSLIEFILKQELTHWDVSTPEGRSGFVNAAKAHITHVKDPLLLDSYLRKIAFWSGVSFSDLSQSSNKAQSYQKKDQAPVTSETKFEELGVEARLIALILQHPETAKASLLAHNVFLDFFTMKAEAHAAWHGLSPDSPLAFVDIDIPEDRLRATVDYLVKNFLKVKYQEESSRLSAQIASATSDSRVISDPAMLTELLSRQQELRVRYSQ